MKNLGDNYSVQERFFRQYYNAFREELNKPFEKTTKKYSLGYLATKTTLLEIYEKLIKKDYNKFLNELLIYLEPYKYRSFYLLFDAVCILNNTIHCALLIFLL